MAEWEVHGRAVASYTLIVDAETEEEAREKAEEEGCPYLDNVNEVSDAEVLDVKLFQL